MQLPGFHDSEIVGVCINYKALIITLKLDYCIGNPRIFTFYLKNCKKLKYWYNYLKKYHIDGVSPKGAPGINDIKIKRKEIVIYPHNYDSAVAIEISKGKSREVKFPKHFLNNKKIKIECEEVITSLSK